MTGSDKEETESEGGKLPPALQADPEAKTYVYRDFANLPEDTDSDDSPPPKRGNSESSIRVQKFPVKLYAILSQKEFSDIVTWMPHGRSWKVLKPNLFESLVMPLFFEYSNYHSFNRLVNAWSFRRLGSGPDRGSYYHELFLRGKPHLQKHMRRLPKTHKKLAMKKQDEPDFYKMDKESPLPELPEAPANVLAMRRQAMTQAAAINSATSPPYGSVASLNPSLAGRLPSSVAGYGSLVANRSALESYASAGGMDSAAARYAALEHQAGIPSSVASLGGAASLPSSSAVASLPSSSYLSSSAAASLPPTAASLQAHRASLGGMPLSSAAAGLPPTQRDLVAPPPQHPLESSDPVAAQHYQYQRMRHLQHLQMFQRQMETPGGGAPGAGPTDEELLRQYRAFGGAGGPGAGGSGGSLGRGRPPYM